MNIRRGILPFPFVSLGRASGCALARTAGVLLTLIQKQRGTECAPLFLAQRKGFEPLETFASTVFKTAAIDHSAISAYFIVLCCPSTV